VTHQQHLHVERESERIRLETERERARNTVRCTPAGFVVATDGALRVVAVQLDVHQLLALRQAVNEAIAAARRDDDTAPITLRGSVLLTD
jgi:hypothetical protein